MNWLISLWTKWKVHISVVGGALVIATAYAKCTVEPNLDSVDEAVEEAPAEESSAAEASTTTPTTINITDGTTGNTTTNATDNNGATNDANSVDGEIATDQD